ncbi:hypothetical protein EP717_09930 [Salmonella enterica subsp. enterica serovar Typhimurium]|nr:hypothetical protein [Salmonella enterica]EAY3043815.1 hypothetical protein [Salmonella enterica subsp. enterica serovar Typhimurium]
MLLLVMRGISPDSKFLIFMTLLRKAFRVLFTKNITYLRFCETPEETESLNEIIKTIHINAPSPKRD